MKFRQPTASASSSAAAARRRRRRRWLLIVLLVLLLPVVLALSRSPAVGIHPPPDAADVRAARKIYERVALARATAKPRRIGVTWVEFDAVAAMVGRAAGVDRVALSHEAGVAHLRFSKKLPLGFWLNAHGFLEADKSRSARLRARLGHLPVPSFVVHASINAVGGILRARGASVLPLEQTVRELYLDPGGVSALLNLPPNTKALRALAGLASGQIDPERIAGHYCRLMAAKRADPALLSSVVSQAFAAGDGSAADNRAIFVALSVLMADMDAGALPKGRDSLYRKCGRSKTQFVLQGRADLAKHWVVSAMLTAQVGTDASLALGTWKEISDSGAGGSGFSLVDLAADRSGAFSAHRGTDEAQAAAMRSWLAGATDDRLLPVSALALAEGMTEAAFRARYSSTDSAVYAATVQRIDAELEVLMQ